MVIGFIIIICCKILTTISMPIDFYDIIKIITLVNLMLLLKIKISDFRR